MSGKGQAALEQKKQFETRRKVEMALDWIAMHARLREQAGAFGRMTADFVWEAGGVKKIVLTDTVTVEDLTDAERELIMRKLADGGKETSQVS